MMVLDQSHKEVQVLKKNLIITAKKAIRIGTWNTQTPYQTGKL